MGAAAVWAWVAVSGAAPPAVAPGVKPPAAVPAAVPAKAPAALPVAPAKPVVPLTAVSLQQRFDTQVKPLLTQHCFRCHGGGKSKGDVSLDKYATLTSVQADRKTWLHVADVVSQKIMPPEERPPLKPEEVAALTGWINDAANFIDPLAPRNPGRVAIHRLNKTEYNNTVRDLLGVADFRPADDFPADDSGYGFDNIADVLSMSPLLAEKYLTAAEQVLEKAVPAENPAVLKTTKYPDAKLDASGDGNVGGNLQRNGAAGIVHPFPVDGTYEVRVHASQDKFGDEPARMAVRLDFTDLKQFDVPNPRGGKPVIYKIRTPVKAGKHRVSAAYLNNKVDNDNADKKKRGDRNLYVDLIEVEGPFDAPPAPASEAYKRVFFVNPGPGVPDEAAARQVLEKFATRAFRRPATAEEVASLLKVYRAARADREAHEPAVKLAMAAVLCSPRFLYRIEIDPPTLAPGSVHPISDYELATRLSYFLWSSTPDDQLMLLAQSNSLHNPDILSSQIKRMLADPKAQTLVTNFAGQWLEIRLLEDWSPDKKNFPDFDDALRAAMKRETELFFQNLIREDRPVLDLLAADYTYVNERLAKHYGISGVTGEDFRKVSLTGTHRAGVLTQASVLTVTAMPNRTSPVKRGKFILENVLGTPPPPPPADVPALPDKPKDVSTASVRQRLETHRANPTCAVCHNRMDPLGFAMENFDAVGAWRTKDGSFDIDASGKLPDGTPIKGAEDLRSILMARKDQFIHCLTEKMLTYALGRGTEYYDEPTIREIGAGMAKDNFRTSALILGIVKSDAFQKRRIPTAEELAVKAVKPAEKPPEKK